jgi:branched-chain amino acid transport system substrate-binding protein
VLALVLAACQPSATATPAPATDVPPTTALATQAPADTDAPAPTQAPEATAAPTEAPEPTEVELGEPLKIGVMQDLTGGLLLFGNEAWNGLQLGFEYATDGTMAAGNRPIELIIKDDTSSPDVAAAAARELIEAEGVEILIGNSSSAAALQVQTIAAENDIVYIAGPAAAPTITAEAFEAHTFRVCRNAAQDGLTMAAWSLENIGDQYLILAEDYAFGQSTAAGFQAAFGALGATFLTEEPIYAPSDTTDFTPYIQQILDLQPEGLILIWATNTSGTILFQQLADQGVAGQIPFITGFSSNDTIPLLDPGFVGATGLIVYHYTLPQTEANDWLVEQHNAQFDGNPDLFTECGFATAQAVVAALEATGGDASSQALIGALEGLSFEGPKGTYTIRPQDHQALAPMYIVELISTTDPDEGYYELVQEVSGEASAPPCAAPGRCE